MKYFDNTFWKMLAGFAVIILLGLISVALITCHFDTEQDCARVGL